MRKPGSRIYLHIPAPMSPGLHGAVFVLVALGFALVLSLLRPWQPETRSSAPLQVRLVKVKPPAKKKKKEDQEARQVIETEMDSTLRPEKSRFLGRVNHQAVKETKARLRTNINKLDPARHVGRDSKQGRKGKIVGVRIKERPPGQGDVGLKAGRYAALLPGQGDLAETMRKGFQDHISDDLDESDVVDVNTTEYRWVGYFTAVRKMVAQVFASPYYRIKNSREIREKLREYSRVKMAGKSVVRLTILRSGFLIKSELVHGSGDKQVDDFWLKVLNLAAPYPPLPVDYEKDRLTFTYALDYRFGFERENPEPLEIARPLRRRPLPLP